MVRLIDLGIFDKETGVGFQQIQLRLDIPNNVEFSIQLVSHKEMKKAWTDQEERFDIKFV